MTEEQKPGLWSIYEDYISGLEFGVEGPWDIGDPVHETLTRASMSLSGMLDEDDYEPIRGVFWNDDPLAQLFDNNRKRTNDFSTGSSWAWAFTTAERDAKAGKLFGVEDTLLQRSHFGDMQFLHGMAERDGLPAAKTRTQILRWCEFTYRVATGDVDVNTPLGQVPVDGIPDLFPRQSMHTVAGLFQCRAQIADARKRALGSLLHLIQDSFAAGHVGREPGKAPNRRGPIVSFYSYSKQDHGKHAADDEWRGGHTDAQKIARISGGRDAVDHGAALLKLYSAGARWPAVRAHLESTTFMTIDNPAPSSPGHGYEADPK